MTAARLRTSDIRWAILSRCDAWTPGCIPLAPRLHIRLRGQRTEERTAQVGSRRTETRNVMGVRMLIVLLILILLLGGGGVFYGRGAGWGGPHYGGGLLGLVLLVLLVLFLTGNLGSGPHPI